ncbi:hypothetical protein ACI2JN_25055 [Ochrobactrum teleogrylli]|uniref:hypothetical protein n=1 Tax=Ochrobactrum teleogrylli TaxID=2479765 RepID=UPI0038516B74
MNTAAEQITQSGMIGLPARNENVEIGGMLGEVLFFGNKIDVKHIDRVNWLPNENPNVALYQLAGTISHLSFNVIGGFEINRVLLPDVACEFMKFFKIFRSISFKK